MTDEYIILRIGGLGQESKCISGVVQAQSVEERGVLAFPAISTPAGSVSSGRLKRIISLSNALITFGTQSFSRAFELGLSMGDG
jgi:hypothetical protein